MLWKRVFDWIAAITGLILLSGVFAGIALYILIMDGKPILFRQQRVGQGKLPFFVYKFRTMQDGKITRSGYFLRQTGLDELAQIINILRGEMSLVGPRPLTVYDVQRLGWDDKRYSIRWLLKPGITGLAQLYSGQGAEISWSMDKKYIQQLSLWMDIQIVLLSFAVNLFGKRRVRKFLFNQKAT
ncbi:MAG: sugar transferase [Thiotrichaceae bacterium]